MSDIDEKLNEIEESIEKTLQAQEYEIGDRRLRRPKIKDLTDYEDRMLARKARKENNYKSHVLVRFVDK